MDFHQTGTATAPRQSSFTVLYVAGMGALVLLAAVAGLTLTGERRADFVGTVEIAALVVGAVLLVAAGLGARSTPDASWPRLVAAAAAILVAVQVFLTLTASDPSSAVFLELGGVVSGLLLFAMLRRR